MFRARVCLETAKVVRNLNCIRSEWLDFGESFKNICALEQGPNIYLVVFIFVFFGGIAGVVIVAVEYVSLSASDSLSCSSSSDVLSSCLCVVSAWPRSFAPARLLGVALAELRRLAVSRCRRAYLLSRGLGSRLLGVCRGCVNTLSCMCTSLFASDLCACCTSSRGVSGATSSFTTGVAAWENVRTVH